MPDEPAELVAPDVRHELVGQMLGADHAQEREVRTKWHRAHVTWFFETFVLAEHEPGVRAVPGQVLVPVQRLLRGGGPALRPRPAAAVISRPGASDVGVYRANVDDRMRDLVASLDGGHPREPAPTIELGFHHEQQHQELLLMDIKHVLSLNPLEPAYAGPPAEHSEPDALGWVDVEGGPSEIGHEGDGFAFDNELPRHQQWLEPYRLADRLVTNGEWLQFMEDGGYGATSSGSRTGGPGSTPRSGGPALLGVSRTASGSSTRSTAPRAGRTRARR